MRKKIFYILLPIAIIIMLALGSQVIRSSYISSAESKNQKEIVGSGNLIEITGTVIGHDEQAFERLDRDTGVWKSTVYTVYHEIYQYQIDGVTKTHRNSYGDGTKRDMGTVVTLYYDKDNDAVYTMEQIDYIKNPDTPLIAMMVFIPLIIIPVVIGIVVLIINKKN